MFVSPERISLRLCLSFKVNLSPYVGPFVCLCDFVSIFVPVCVQVSDKELCFSLGGCLRVCLCSRSGVKTNNFKSPSWVFCCVCERKRVCGCVWVGVRISLDNLHWCCCQIGGRALELFKPQLSATIYAHTKREHTRTNKTRVCVNSKVVTHLDTHVCLLVNYSLLVYQMTVGLWECVYVFQAFMDPFTQKATTLGCNTTQFNTRCTFPHTPTNNMVLKCGENLPGNEKYLLKC